MSKRSNRQRRRKARRLRAKRRRLAARRRPPPGPMDGMFIAVYGAQDLQPAPVFFKMPRAH